VWLAVNFAHRGGAKVVPEDTIEVFRKGFAMGGGVVECDVHASAEGTSSSFMTQSLTGRPMAQDPWLRRLFRSCRISTPATVLAPTAV
jgi:hypothetical protein